MTSKQYDALIIGAGFSGMYMLHRLNEQGLNVRVLEAGDGVGGTWYWNRYPGARCDIPSMEYSYQFSEALQQEWEWEERYATQPEILRYAEHVAERFDLLKHIQFNTTVNALYYDEASEQWQIKTASGAALNSRYVVLATGCLSKPNYPLIKGLDQFEKPIYHTGRWPHEGVDFSGQRVGVIGTGSSGIQSIPLIAQQAEQMVVFQRTPNYAIPAYNEPLNPDYVKALKARYAEFRAENWKGGFGANFRDSETPAFSVSADEREAEYEARWRDGGLAFLAAFGDLVTDDAANATARDFISKKIAEKIPDPELASKMLPDGPVGCKRLCVETDYYETFNKDHVELVDLVESPIEGITPDEVRTTANTYQFDSIVLATGFDAMTGAMLSIDIRGEGGLSLQQKWQHGPRTYLGLATADFPNMFMINGPGSPSVLSNMLPSIEHHVNWIADCIAAMRSKSQSKIVASKDAEDAWVDHVNEVADATIFPRCNSWYLGANVPGKKRVFMPYLGVPPYVEKCVSVVENGYEGFLLK